MTRKKTRAHISLNVKWFSHYEKSIFNICLSNIYGVCELYR